MTDAGFGGEVPEVELAMAELQDCGPPSQERELDLSATHAPGQVSAVWRGADPRRLWPLAYGTLLAFSRAAGRGLGVIGSGTVVDDQRCHGSMTLVMD